MIGEWMRVVEKSYNVEEVRVPSPFLSSADSLPFFFTFSLPSFFRSSPSVRTRSSNRIRTAGAWSSSYCPFRTAQMKPRRNTPATRVLTVSRRKMTLM